MPTLHWIGKEKVVNHHYDVPFRLLEHKYGFSECEINQKDTKSGNKIIKGDNLEALKALLPEYEGKIKCIYIDPPYNTGNENWVYNDNVNHPKIKNWLNQVVGKEGEDLTRHDKWLCMMYPRLKLLHKLLSDDGVIFISIDDNEQANLKLICDEIFGSKNFIVNFSWRTDGNFDNQAKIKINHEYIFCYAKKFENFEYPRIIDPNTDKNSKLFKETIRNTIVKNGSKNPISEVTLPINFPADFESGVINSRCNQWPNYNENAIIENYKLTNQVKVLSGWSSKDLLEEFINSSNKPILDSKGQETIFTITKTGAIENIKKRELTSHVISSLYNMGNTQNMSNELKKMGINFDYPKPIKLISYLISMINNKDSIILDSFAGSGTTAHAVLNLNKEDGGNRKFILIEMEEYAETITAERIKRVIKGYGEEKNFVDGIKAEFDFYELGKPLFIDNKLNEEIEEEKLRQYIFYIETKQSLPEINSNDNKYFLSCFNNTSYYFFYEKNQETALDYDFLSTINIKSEQYIIYADNCLLQDDFMSDKNIIFKKIPRDITRL